MSFLPIIINPAAGNNEPILNTLNDVFSDDVKWEVKITHASGDARRFAEEAVARQAAAVGVYGGDGTITEVAQVLANRDIPMLLLPGGTGNGGLQLVRGGEGDARLHFARRRVVDIRITARAALHVLRRAGTLIPLR